MSSTRFSMRRDVRKFQSEVYAQLGKRSFPWRETNDPYHILVSEVMLQQTQAGARTVEKYHAFLAWFPTVQALALASVSDVYALWSGLGYNRRAKYLRDAAKYIVEAYDGAVPREVSLLERLPGVGPYTARAVCVFAFNKPEVLIETNIRTVFIHHFFPRSKAVHDKMLLPLIAATLDTKNPRTWYFALMDYGTALKRDGERAHRRSAHYLRQKPFEGSDRQVRGALLRALKEKPRTLKELVRTSSSSKDRIAQLLVKLVDEGMVMRVGTRYAIP
jgi:A/G-specific adenine glycosylase